MLPDPADKVNWRNRVFRWRSRVSQSLAFLLEAPLHPVFVTGLWFAGVIIPIACFALTISGAPDPPNWQSGAIADYAMLMLDLKVSAPLLPLLIFAMVCFGMAMVKPQLARERFWVRMGVLSGVPLSIHFGVVVSFALSGTDELYSEQGLTTLLMLPLGVVVGIAFGVILLTLIWVIEAGTQFAKKKKGRLGTLIQFVVNVIGVALLVATGVVPIILFCGILFGPALSLAAYAFVFVRTSWQRETAARFSLWQLSGLITWLGGYFAATRATVELVMWEYAQLPTEPSHECYIVTVASQGKARVVGGFEIIDCYGESRQINHQLAYLKCGELAMKTCLPSLHRLLRTRYDKFGPMLANSLRRYGGAEISYWLLKPFEWCARCCLRILLKDYHATAMRLYDSHQRPKS